jgi:ABC-2 type transport system ATP-binding protein
VTGIVVEGLTKSYRRGVMGERIRALDSVSLTIAPGEVFGIIGPNGAGKTTFVGCLLGFLRPDSGTITIDGHAPDDFAIREATGYLPERLVLDRWMSGEAFLGYHHALARLPDGERAGAVASALEHVGLAEAGSQLVRRYSRGMLQRLGLAQALLGNPRYVFLDEPASGVDPAGVVLFRRLLSDLKQRDVTVILNSHQLDQVERVCDRVAFVRAGKVEAIETIAAGATLARVLRVRAAGGAIGGRDTLAALAQKAGAELRDVTSAEARFNVADDAGAALLIQTLVVGGVAVAEVTPEESRLERLFLDAPHDSGGPAPVTPPSAPPSPSRFAPPESGS